MFGMGKNDNYHDSYRYIYAACIGKVMPIDMLDDSIYSTKILGDGYAVVTTQKCVYSPVDGEIVRISNNGHSFNIRTEDGLDVLVHVGKNSNCDESKTTKLFKKVNDKVGQGKKLCEVDCDNTHKECTVEVVVNNSDSLEEFMIISDNVMDIKSPVIKYKKSL